MSLLTCHNICLSPMLNFYNNIGSDFVTGAGFATRFYSTKNGHSLNSKYWQDYKRSLPDLPSNLYEIAVGCLLGDACLYRVSKDTKIKFEQGYMHEGYLFSLFELFKLYTFHEKPYTRLEIRGDRKGQVKSYSFRTFTHTTFNSLWDLFIIDGKKSIRPGLITNHLTDLGLTHWIMDDGSLQNDKKSLILHTQSYTKAEVEQLASELNSKFKLNSRVIPHKVKYHVIFIPSSDAKLLYGLISPHIHSSMKYKLPVID